MVPVSHDTEASTIASGENETKWNVFEIDAGLLKDSGNLLAVEVHQKHQPHKISSDLNFAIEFVYRHSEATYLRQFTSSNLTRSISQLTLALPPGQSSTYQHRWKSATLHGGLPDDPGALSLRANFLRRLQRYDDELAALNKLLSLNPDPLEHSEFLANISYLRRLSQCLHALGREDEALATENRITTTIPRREEGLSPLMLDLSDSYNINLCDIEQPFPSSLSYWGEHLPEIFDPGEGPDFDVRGTIQLNSGIYTDGPNWLIGKSFSDASNIPVTDTVRIEVNQFFGAIHFLQTCHEQKEHLGAEVAHYLAHYEDGTQERIPVVIGEGTMDLIHKGRHESFWKNIRHFAFEKSFKWNQWNNDENTFGLCRQSWINPHYDKRVTHLDFVSGQKQAARFCSPSPWQLGKTSSKNPKACPQNSRSSKPVSRKRPIQATWSIFENAATSSGKSFPSSRNSESTTKPEHSPTRCSPSHPDPKASHPK